MDNSPLSKLPAGLRNHIYELVLSLRQPIVFRRGSANVHNHCPHAIHLPTLATPHPLALPSTCKETRAETLQFFHATNTFELRFHSDEERGFRPALKCFFDLLGRTNLPSLRNFIVDVGSIDYMSIGVLRTAVKLLQPILLREQVGATFKAACMINGSKRIGILEQVRIELNTKRLRDSCDEMLVVVCSIPRQWRPTRKGTMLELLGRSLVRIKAMQQDD